MEVKNVKILNKLPTIASFDIHVHGLILRELRLMETHGKTWIAFPSRQYEAEGKKKYFAYIGVETPKKDAFEKKVIELLASFLSQAPKQPTFTKDEEIPF